MKQKELLIEIGVEELPVEPLIKIIKDIDKIWQNILDKNRLKAKFYFFYTPRRLVLEHNLIDEKQDRIVEKIYGPPTNIAIKNNKVTKVGLGFAKKCNVNFSEIKIINQKGRDILFFEKNIEGKLIQDLLENMVTEWIKSMKFGKMMKWGSSKFQFIRPIRWINILLNNQLIDINVYGIKSKNITFVHRMINFNPIKNNSIEEYKNILKNGKVILSQFDRKNIILDSFIKIENKFDIKIDRDNNLIEEIILILENPTVLIANFDKKFLILPNEIIITSMKTHQKYFPIFKNGKLDNRFIFISNAIDNNFEIVKKGNEKVLSARLSDALFFYENDLKNGMQTDGLKNIIFIKNLGSLADKIEREKKISRILLNIHLEKLKKETEKSEEELEKLLDETISLAKSDLLTDVVYEFTELQGLMGYYYSKSLNKNILISNAIKEQYYPVQEGDKLQSSIFSAIVSMIIKFDTIISLFSINKIPTASKDPFALRRAVNSIIKISIKYNLSLKIYDIFTLLEKNYKKIEIEEIYNFFIDRIYKIIPANPSIIKSVLHSQDRDILEIIKKIKALDIIANRDNFREDFLIFKRVANIVKDLDENFNIKIDKKLFNKGIENILFEKYLEIINKNYQNYENRLNDLFGLKNILDQYFEEVLINSENDDLRINRQSLIFSIYKKFKEISDIKYISI